MTISCIAVDDEQLALELLIDNINKIPFFRLAGTARNALDVIRLLQEEQVDLVFLDIQMPGLSGIQLATNLKGKTRIIFLTAYDHYALESYAVNAIDYLVKPVSFERFLEAAMKALDVFSPRQGRAAEQVPVEPGNRDNRNLFVNVEYNMVKIPVDDVLMIEGYKDYVKIHLQSANRPVITRMSMKHLEERLHPFGFIRVHKSYIISLTRISSIHKSFLKVGELEIPVSEHYKDILMEHVSRSNIL